MEGNRRLGLVLQPTDYIIANEIGKSTDVIDIRIPLLENWIDDTVLEEGVVTIQTDATKTTIGTGIGYYSVVLDNQEP